MQLTLREWRELQRLAPINTPFVETEAFKRGEFKPVTAADYRPGCACTPKTDAAIERRLAGAR